MHVTGSSQQDLLADREIVTEHAINPVVVQAASTTQTALTIHTHTICARHELITVIDFALADAARSAQSHSVCLCK
jgi:hypothetical protein